MASAPKPNLPIFFNDLMPLNSRDHSGWHSTQFPDVSFLSNHHAIPVTVDEFIDTQRHYPIVFSAGDNPVPLALMGLNEGVNTFVDDEGKITEDGKVLPLDVKVGDKVLFGKYAGTEVKVEGEDFLILSSRDVLAVLA